MLRCEVGDLVATVLHELAHATVFKPGDATFNESVATFLGNEGARRFLGLRYGPTSSELVRFEGGLHDEAVFTTFIDALHAKLDAIYKSDLPAEEKRTRRDVAMLEAKVDYIALKPKFKAGGFGGFERRRLTNAVILGYRRYHFDLKVFEDVLELWGGDFARAIGVFQVAEREEKPLEFLAHWVSVERARRGATLPPARTSGKS
jgi:predicted aminopeptidase